MDDIIIPQFPGLNFNHNVPLSLIKEALSEGWGIKDDYDYAFQKLIEALLDGSLDAFAVHKFDSNGNETLAPLEAPEVVYIAMQPFMYLK